MTNIPTPGLGTILLCAFLVLFALQSFGVAFPQMALVTGIVALSAAVCLLLGK